jgi:N-methylhydantoinase A/oxoprolinase/acetone carboxylase beta subunit
MNIRHGIWHFWIDRGGTFTDVVATNALLERKGDLTVLVTTKGF